MTFKLSRGSLQLGQFTLRPEMIIPRMRWWEWAWYVPAVVASGLVYDRLSDWLEGVLAPIPVLGWFSWLITLVSLGVLFTGISYVTLPARQARKDAPGEGVLACALWLCGVGLQWMLRDHLLW